MKPKHNKRNTKAFRKDVKRRRSFLKTTRQGVIGSDVSGKYWLHPSVHRKTTIVSVPHNNVEDNLKD